MKSWEICWTPSIKEKQGKSSIWTEEMWEIYWCTTIVLETEQSEEMNSMISTKNFDLLSTSARRKQSSSTLFKDRYIFHYFLMESIYFIFIFRIRWGTVWHPKVKLNIVNYPGLVSVVISKQWKSRDIQRRRRALRVWSAWNIENWFFLVWAKGLLPLKRLWLRRRWEKWWIRSSILTIKIMTASWTSKNCTKWWRSFVRGSTAFQGLLAKKKSKLWCLKLMSVGMWLWANRNSMIFIKGFDSITLLQTK